MSGRARVLLFRTVMVGAAVYLGEEAIRNAVDQSRGIELTTIALFLAALCASALWMLARRQGKRWAFVKLSPAAYKPVTAIIFAVVVFIAGAQGGEIQDLLFAVLAGAALSMGFLIPVGRPPEADRS